MRRGLRVTASLLALALAPGCGGPTRQQQATAWVAAHVAIFGDPSRSAVVLTSPDAQLSRDLRLFEAHEQDLLPLCGASQPQTSRLDVDLRIYCVRPEGESAPVDTVTQLGPLQPDSRLPTFREARARAAADRARGGRAPAPPDAAEGHEARDAVRAPLLAAGRQLAEHPCSEAARQSYLQAFQAWAGAKLQDIRSRADGEQLWDTRDDRLILDTMDRLVERGIVTQADHQLAALRSTPQGAEMAARAENAGVGARPAGCG